MICSHVIWFFWPVVFYLFFCSNSFALQQLKEKTGALQSIYRRKASMPSPESTRPTTLEEKMSPMPIGHQPVPLDPVAGGDISDMPIQEYEAFEEEDFGVEPSEEESGMTKTETAGDASRPMPMRQLRDAKSVQDLVRLSNVFFLLIQV